MQTSVSVFETTFQKAHEWLMRLVTLGDFEDESQAYTALRAVLHSLRDRLIAEEATHLGAQLPMLVRGFYYEGWKLSPAPNKERSKQAFLDSVRESLRRNVTVDPERACRAVFALLNEKISEGELNDVRAELPKDVLGMWP